MGDDVSQYRSNQYKMYLLDRPPDNIVMDTPVTLILSDGKLKGDFSILRKRSRIIEELVEAKQNDCGECQQKVFLPDFTLNTAAHLMELLTTGATVLDTEDDKKDILQLRNTLQCCLISRCRSQKVELAGGQCGECLR